MTEKEFMPESMREQIRMQLLDHCKEISAKLLSGEMGISFEKLKDDAEFKMQFSKSIEDACQRFRKTHLLEEEDIVKSIYDDKNFWGHTSISMAVDALIKSPNTFSPTSFKPYAFDDILPQRMN